MLARRETLIYPASSPTLAPFFLFFFFTMPYKMSFSLKSLLSSIPGKVGGTPNTELFTKTDPAVDGEECLHDCDSCTIKYPRGFKIEESDLLFGFVKGWSTHVLVGTGKTDWVRDVADEKGSVMEAIDKAHKPDNGVSFFCSLKYSMRGRCGGASRRYNAITWNWTTGTRAYLEAEID